jgi:hypothetical protein
MDWDVAFDELVHGDTVSFDNSGNDVEPFCFPWLYHSSISAMLAKRDLVSVHILTLAYVDGYRKNNSRIFDDGNKLVSITMEII